MYVCVSQAKTCIVATIIGLYHKIKDEYRCNHSLDRFKADFYNKLVSLYGKLPPEDNFFFLGYGGYAVVFGFIGDNKVYKLTGDHCDAIVAHKLMKRNDLKHFAKIYDVAPIQIMGLDLLLIVAERAITIEECTATQRLKIIKVCRILRDNAMDRVLGTPDLVRLQELISDIKDPKSDQIKREKEFGHYDEINIALHIALGCRSLGMVNMDLHTHNLGMRDSSDIPIVFDFGHYSTEIDDFDNFLSSSNENIEYLITFDPQP